MRTPFKLPGITVLFICTGNQCRSPMAAAIARRELGRRGADMEVRSAGFVPPGVAPPVEAIESMRAIGIDIASHRSRLVSVEDIDAAGLVIAMTRQHLVDLSLLSPAGWTRMFTVADATRWGRAAGPRRPGEPLAAWVERLGRDRTRPGLLALDPRDDVPDPMGGTRRDFDAVRDRLSREVGALAGLMAGA